MRLLFVDCCIKEDEMSRTRRLCHVFLKECVKNNPQYELETLILKDKKLLPLLETDVEQRDRLIKSGETDHPMFVYARQFAGADRILVGSPYWDLSFPSLLKVYIEHIFVNGIAFIYQGSQPVGLCNAKKLLYLQTAGGFIGENEPGAVYLKAVCQMLGISGFSHICAEGMDVLEIDREKQWETALEKIIQVTREW